MAFNPSGASNGTITMGSADNLKGDPVIPITNHGPVPISHAVSSVPPPGSATGSCRKHRHDDEEQGKLFVGGLR